MKSPVVQSDDYYPFGLAFNSYSRENSEKNNYLYNGKELQDELDLGWLDYGARMYMPEIGRWGVVDPLADKYEHYGPYTYTLNNPVNLTDSDGRVVRDKDGNIVFAAVETMEVEHPSGGRATVVRGYIFADDGTKIEAFQNLNGEKGWDTDCHGQTFADGKFWINNDQVRGILKGDKYQKVKEGDESKGDVVVYTDKEGRVEDSRTVSKTGTGEGTCVSGQGGLEEENYEVPIDQAWCNEAGSTKREIYRKAQKDRIMTCEEAQTLIDKARSEEKPIPKQ